MGRNRRRLTGFGKVLREFAEDMGIMGAPALAHALTEAGYNSDPEPPRKPGVSRTAVDNWMKGRQPAPPEVMPYIAQVLELDDEKKMRLAWVYAWEQLC